MSKQKNTPTQRAREARSAPAAEITVKPIDREISTSKLTAGLPFQRAVDLKHVDRLIQNWDERLLDPVIVSFRDGKYYVVDGQHRVTALRKMNRARNVMVPCKVYIGLTYEQEAALCYKLDHAKRRLSLAQSVNALLESGTDAEALEIKRLVEANGFQWALDGKTGAENEIAASRAIINAYRLLGGAAFDRMLRLMRETWHGAPTSLKASMLSGVARFLKAYETEIKDRTFISHLSIVEPEEIIRLGKLDFSTSSAPLRYARVLWKKYNAQRGGRKLTYRLQN